MAPPAPACCSAQKLFLFINIGFAVYAGALLATSARLTWDPSTYTWFRWLCEAQYRVTTGYLLAAGLWLVALVYLAAAAVHPRVNTTLHLYFWGVLVLTGSELVYAAWMGVSLAAWWRSSPQAAAARQGMDMLHDLKPVLFSLERHQELARQLQDMIEEVERETPNNVYVVVVFVLISFVLQVSAAVVSWRLRRALPSPGGSVTSRARAGSLCSRPDSDGESPREWRRKANLHMYSIIDKIF